MKNSTEDSQSTKPKEFNCQLCGNTGAVAIKDADGFKHLRECRCMRKRRSLRAMELSGLSSQLERYTFSNYQTLTEEQKNAKMKCLDYVKNPQGRWLIISGQSGSGKTHLCTAVCKGLMDKGMFVKYMRWQEDATRLKAIVTDADEYFRKLYKFCDAHVLYIDDFWKGKVTDADISLAFRILDNRYANEYKMTIISTELTTKQLLSIDEAVGGRIIERANDFTIKAPHSNWRTKGKHE